jgi:hypothetical protein
MKIAAVALTINTLVRVGALVVAAQCVATAAAAVDDRPNIAECYPENWPIGNSFDARRISPVPPAESFKCVRLDQSCKSKTVEIIEKNWKSEDWIKKMSVGKNRPIVPMQVFLELKLRACNVDDQDFMVPSDARLASIGPKNRDTVHFDRKYKVTFRRPDGKTEPCVDQLWREQSPEGGIETVDGPRYWMSQGVSGCDWDRKKKLAPETLQSKDWITLHSMLIDRRLYPELQRSNFQDTVIELTDKYSFDRVPLRLLDPVTPTSEQPRVVDDKSARSGAARDLALAGSGALLLLIARWLRELLQSRQKGLAVPTSSTDTASRDVRVTGRWAEESGPPKTSHL